MVVGTVIKQLIIAGLKIQSLNLTGQTFSLIPCRLTKDFRWWTYIINHILSLYFHKMDIPVWL